MKNLKEYFKQRLLEDIGTAELMANIEKKHDAAGTDPSDQLDRIARSRNLYVPDPNNPSKPLRIPGARLHPRVITALANAAHHGMRIPDEDVAIIKDFVKLHKTHFVGADNNNDMAYPPTFRTDDPSGVLGNIFGAKRLSEAILATNTDRQTQLRMRRARGISTSDDHPIMNLQDPLNRSRLRNMTPEKAKAYKRALDTAMSAEFIPKNKRNQS